ncbi:hypothetical protein BH10ACT8_BH10ACT8_17310 [soil metagenome]
MGTLDDQALQAAVAEDADAALAMLADMMTATDEKLRAAVQAVAARLVLDRSRVGPARRRGTGRPRRVPADRGGDLDLDGSMDAIAGSLAAGRSPSLDELVARDWGRPELALALVIDRSGSMNGPRLAAAAVTAAACATRTPDEYAVLAFDRDVEVIKSMSATSTPTDTVDKVLRLRGHGVTGLAKALAAAAFELSSARAGRRVVVLLSDCRATDEHDPRAAAGALENLVILAPADDCAEAARLAALTGARFAAMDNALSAPALLDELLD